VAEISEDVHMVAGKMNPSDPRRQGRGRKAEKLGQLPIILFQDCHGVRGTPRNDGENGNSNQDLLLFVLDTIMPVMYT